MKKIVTMSLVFMLLINIFSIDTSASTPDSEKFYIEYDGEIYKYKERFVKLIMDGQEIQTGDMPAIIITEVIDGKDVARTLVPVREVCESEQIGGTVEWNGDKQEVYISYEDKFIVLKINDQKAIVNNEEVMLDVPAKLIRDVNNENVKTMVPLRFILETFGYEVTWNGQDYAAEMTKKDDNETDKTDNNDQADNTDNGNDNTDNGNDNTDNQNNEENNNEQNNNDENNNNDEDETLDSLDSNGAKKELPTELKDNPVIWMVEDDILTEVGKKYTETAVVRKLQPTTKIKSINYNETDIGKSFTIEASSAITDIKKSYWNNKLIIDIDNSKWDMDTYEKTFDDNPIVTGVRSSQFSFEPEITRVVFDLKGEGYKFNVRLSEDRKNVIIDVLNNSIYGIHLGQNDKGDYIKVFGVRAPDVKPFRLSNPDRIVFDLPNSESLLSTLSSPAMGQYVTEIRTAQFNDSTTRVVVETDGQADFKISQDSNSATIIQLIEPSYNNIKYVNFDNPTIILQKNGATIDLSKVEYTDHYLDREYVITLPGDYTDLFGNGNIKVNDGIINSIDIKNNNNGNTVLTIKENSIYEFRITEDEEFIYIKAFKPKELYSQIIVIDPGHGGKDPGAMDNGLIEKTANLDIVLYLKEHLDKDNSIKVYYSRLDDTYPTLGERCDLANAVQADFFVSVHNNWYNPGANGTEVYYLSGTNTLGLNSFELADIFQRQIVKAAGTKDRGSKNGNLYVLRNTEMPAVLLEIAFLSNTSDAAKLKSTTFKKNVAGALYKAILEAFKTYPTGR